MFGVGHLLTGSPHDIRYVHPLFLRLYPPVLSVTVPFIRYHLIGPVYLNFVQEHRGDGF